MNTNFGHLSYMKKSDISFSFFFSPPKFLQSRKKIICQKSENLVHVCSLKNRSLVIRFAEKCEKYIERFS